MRSIRYTAGVLSSLMLFSLTGCGGERASMDPRYPEAPIRQSEPQRQGMSTRQKVVMLAGAAALYYLYNKHKNRQGAGPEGQYYRSRNGRIYYRDANGEAHWVTPPQQPIAVPVDEYERYTGRNYEHRTGEVIREAPAGW